MPKLNEREIKAITPQIINDLYYSGYINITISAVTGNYRYTVTENGHALIKTMQVHGATIEAQLVKAYIMTLVEAV